MKTKALTAEERKGITVMVPIKKEEHRKAALVAAVNGWGIRWQIAEWIREGIKRDFPKSGLVVK